MKMPPHLRSLRSSRSPPLLLLLSLLLPLAALPLAPEGSDPYVETGNLPRMSSNPARPELDGQGNLVAPATPESALRAPMPTRHDATERRPNNYSESWVVCSEVVCADLMPPKDTSGAGAGAEEDAFPKEERAACLFGCRAAMEGSLLVERHCGEYCEGIWTHPIVQPYLWEGPSAGQQEHWVNLCSNRCLQGFAIHKPVIEEAKRAAAEKATARQQEVKRKLARAHR